MPSKVQANFWVDDLQVRNINVKTYESSDRGNAGVSGKFYISGTLNIQPKGYIWAMQQPFRIGMQVDEEPRSGTIVFTALTKRGIDQMVELAISDYSLDSKIVGMLGRLDYVPYKERRASLAKSVATAAKRASDTAAVQRKAERLFAKHGIDYEEDEYYSGRGMYGKFSPLAYDLGDPDDGPRSAIGKALQRLGFYVDNLGMGWIYYLR